MRAGEGLLETILATIERARDALQLQVDLTERLSKQVIELEERVVALEGEAFDDE